MGINDKFSALVKERGSADVFKAQLEAVKDDLKRLEDRLTASESRNLALQNEIDSLTAANLALRQENDNLKQELSELKDWEAQKKRYDVKKLPVGLFAYQANVDSEDGKPVANDKQAFCQHCFDFLHVLSPLHKGKGAFYFCGHCKNEFHYEIPQSIPTRKAITNDPLAKHRSTL